MKATPIIFLLLTVFSSYAQRSVNSGKITYQETIKLQLDLDSDNPMFEQIKGQLPDAQKSNKLLTFKGSESLYSNVSGQEHDQSKQIESDEGLTINMSFEMPEEIFYFHSEQQKSIQQRSLMGRTFLVTGTTPLKWKITSDTKEILGYTCTKAIAGDSAQIAAWFTPQIPAFFGPEKYNGLPGLILEVSIDNGQRQILATKVDLSPVETAISAPANGKKVTSEQYAKLMEKKMKEMRQEFGGSGNMIIITSDQ